MLYLNPFRTENVLRMDGLTLQPWEIGSGMVLLALLVVLVFWLLMRKRPTPEELEQQRRRFLGQSGRLVDGMLLDINEMVATDGRTLTLLVYDYRIGGVDYECSQDITGMGEVLDVAEIRAGFPCSVRYQPGNPQNSIVVAEQWSGLRSGLPVLPDYEDPEPIDTSHHRQGRY
jgi:hypothetical protein